jgi:hypothetical protein
MNIEIEILSPEYAEQIIDFADDITNNDKYDIDDINIKISDDIIYNYDRDKSRDKMISELDNIILDYLNSIY